MTDALGHEPHDTDFARNRVVEAVLGRIAAAPPPAWAVRQRSRAIYIATWATPALLAAAAVLIASSIALARREAEARIPATVAEALGLDAPLQRFVATGTVDTWALLTQHERRP